MFSTIETKIVFLLASEIKIYRIGNGSGWCLVRIQNNPAVVLFVPFLYASGIRSDPLAPVSVCHHPSPFLVSAIVDPFYLHLVLASSPFSRHPVGPHPIVSVFRTEISFNKQFNMAMCAGANSSYIRRVCICCFCSNTINSIKPLTITY